MQRCEIPDGTSRRSSSVCRNHPAKVSDWWKILCRKQSLGNKPSNAPAFHGFCDSWTGAVGDRSLVGAALINPDPEGLIMFYLPTPNFNACHSTVCYLTASFVILFEPRVMEGLVPNHTSIGRADARRLLLVLPSKPGPAAEQVLWVKSRIRLPEAAAVFADPTISPTHQSPPSHLVFGFFSFFFFLSFIFPRAHPCGRGREGNQRTNKLGVLGVLQ